MQLPHVVLHLPVPVYITLAGLPSRKGAQEREPPCRRGSTAGALKVVKVATKGAGLELRRATVGGNGFKETLPGALLKGNLAMATVRRSGGFGDPHGVKEGPPRMRATSSSTRTPCHAV